MVLCLDGAKGTLLAHITHHRGTVQEVCVCVSSEDFVVHSNNEAMAVVLLHAYVGQTM